MKTTCDNYGASKRKGSMGAMLAATLWALESCLTPIPEAWAQRKSAEPEANPQFQQDVQGPSSSNAGQPIDSGANPSSPTSMTQEQPSTIGGVQIGQAPQRRAPAAAAINPLDVKVSIRVREAPLATFLEIISNQAKVNFIMTEGLKSKTVTAFLQNVSVREALQILLEIKGLTYQQIGRSNSYIIRERTKDVPLKITRIYTLSFAPLVPIFDKSSGGGQGQQSNFTSIATGQSPGQGSGSSGQASADSGIAIALIIKSILTKDGQIAIDARTNSLIVTDIPEVFPQVEQIISELDKKAPQVMIEAQIVEINSDKTKNLGLEWGGADGTLGSFNGGQRDTMFPLGLTTNLGQYKFFPGVSPNNIISAVGSSGSNGSTGLTQTIVGQGGTTITSAIPGASMKMGIVDLSQLSVVLRALVAHSEARFLGKPKVLTLNNKTATIEVTQDQAVAQQTNITAAQGAAQTTTSVERHETGVKLLVTPQVNKEGYITMLVQPEYTNVIESVVSSAASPVFDPLSRKESTLVRVKNGQTLVLGGLLSSTETKQVRKVPLLGYIPIIGWLFTSTMNTRNNTDLVIFLTPTIVND